MAKLGNTEKFFIRVIERVQQTPTSAVINVTKFYWLGCETANSLNRSQEAVECSDKNSAWAKYIPGKRGGTIEATAYAEIPLDENEADLSQQMTLLKSLYNGQRVWVLVGKRTAAGAFANDTADEGDLMQGVISGISDTNDFGAVASRTFNLTIDGEITHYDEV